uniref:Uncharacterized protein n=1 Tax=Arundo donax TaxID=35708 RepID=A0A0A9HSB5_ARUDO
MLELPDYMKKPVHLTQDQKQFADMEQQVVEIMKSLATIQSTNTTLIKSMEENVQAVRDLTSRKPEMTEMVDEIRSEMGRLRQEVSLIQHNPIPTVMPFDIQRPPLISTPPPILAPLRQCR